MVIRNLFVHFVINTRHQVFQAHHAAFPGLEGLAVLTVHSAKAQEGQFRLRPYQPCLPGTAENLGKVKLLPLVHHIDNLIWPVILHTPHNGSQIRRVIEGSAVRL